MTPSLAFVDGLTIRARQVFAAVVLRKADDSRNHFPRCRNTRVLEERLNAVIRGLCIDKMSSHATFSRLCARTRVVMEQICLDYR